MELILVRHALPVRVDATHDGSPADPGLSARGTEQAERLVGALAHHDVDAIYTSAARRAIETAAPLAATLGIVPLVEPGLAEFDAGHSSYVPVEELRAAGDPRWEMLLKGDLYVAGVDPDDFRATVVAAVERIAAAHPGGRAVLVMHAGSINAWGGHVLGQSRPLWFGPAYCSISRFAAGRDGRRSVVSLNEIGHVHDLLHR